MSKQKPEFEFLRATPADLEDNPPLASSLQAFETSLQLFALGKFPAALLACVNAWEGALKAAFKIEPEEWCNLVNLVEKADEQLSEDARWSKSKNTELRRKRNELTHYGYAPRDSDECAKLLLVTAYPGLACIYEGFFDYRLMWQQYGPSVKNFMDLPSSDMGNVGITPDLGDLLWLALDVYKHEHSHQKINTTWYFEPIAHMLRRGYHAAWTSTPEHQALEEVANYGGLMEHLEKHKSKIAHIIGSASAVFDCPICHDGFDCFIVGFDLDAMEKGSLKIEGCMCAACHFALPPMAGFIIAPLIKEDIHEKWSKARYDFGFD